MFYLDADDTYYNVDPIDRGVHIHKLWKYVRDNIQDDDVLLGKSFEV